MTTLRDDMEQLVINVATHNYHCTELVQAIFERLQAPVEIEEQSMYWLEEMIRDTRLMLYYVNSRLIDVGGLMWHTRQLAIRLPLLQEALEHKRLAVMMAFHMPPASRTMLGPRVASAGISQIEPELLEPYLH